MENNERVDQQRVNDAIVRLREGLGPFVARELEARFKLVPRGKLDRMANDATLKNRPIEQWDVAALLRVMEATWNDVFRPTLGSRTERSLVSELLDWRNKWAHQVPFSGDDTHRALDSAERLLRSIGAAQAEDVGRIRRELLNEQMRGASPPATQAVAEEGSGDRSGSPEEVIRAIRTERHQSWMNLRKAARAILDLPHEPFGTVNVANSSKSTVRTMQRETGVPLDRLKEMLDSM